MSKKRRQPHSTFMFHYSFGTLAFWMGLATALCTCLRHGKVTTKTTQAPVGLRWREPGFQYSRTSVNFLPVAFQVTRVTSRVIVKSEIRLVEFRVADKRDSVRE